MLHIHIHKCAVLVYRPFHSKPTSVLKQLPCIWPYSFSSVCPLIWMPALFFFLLLFCCHTRRLFLDGENEAEHPVSQSQAQLLALRWVQLVGVRGSSIHTGQIWIEVRTTVEGEGGGEQWRHRKLLFGHIFQKCTITPDLQCQFLFLTSIDVQNVIIFQFSCFDSSTACHVSCFRCSSINMDSFWFLVVFFFLQCHMVNISLFWVCLVLYSIIFWYAQFVKSEPLQIQHSSSTVGHLTPKDNL